MPIIEIGAPTDRLAQIHFEISNQSISCFWVEKLLEGYLGSVWIGLFELIY